MSPTRWWAQLLIDNRDRLPAVQRDPKYVLRAKRCWIRLTKDRCLVDILVYHLLLLARPRSTIVSRILESTLLIDMTWHRTANAKRSQDCDLTKCKDRINHVDISCHCFSRSCLVDWPEGELIRLALQ